MKLCPFCGRAIEDDARYCSGCGKKINEHDEITHNPITEAKGYAALSKVCSRFGCIWIVFAVVNIALSIVMTITNKDSEAMTTMGKLRSSCFLMGIIFLVFSVVLKVG